MDRFSEAVRHANKISERKLLRRHNTALGLVLLAMLIMAVGAMIAQLVFRLYFSSSVSF
jgi:hypothetical protein